MDRFLFLTVDGLSRGAVYAAFALALVLIWRGTRIVNFAQGVMAVATAYVAYSVAGVTGSYWVGFAAGLLGGLVLGAVVERAVMRRVQQAPPLNAAVATGQTRQTCSMSPISIFPLSYESIETSSNSSKLL